MVWFFVILVALTGACLPLQAGINSQLAQHMQHPLQAAVISFLGGTLALSLACIAFGYKPLNLELLKHVPWYLCVGGLLGGSMVLVSLIMAPRLGAAVLVGALVTGQLLSSVLLDHFGAAGYQTHAFSFMRLIGVSFLMAGVILLRVF